MFLNSPVCAHRCELPKLLVGKRIGVEIGVLHGNYSLALLSQWPGYLHLIDPWRSYEGYPECQRTQTHRFNFKEAMKRLRPHRTRTRVWRDVNSESIANQIGQVDFVYVDGNHTLKYVTEDLRIWWPRIKPGGILAGHDLFQVDEPDVTEAVVLFAAEHKKDIYMIRGKDGCECAEGGVPSWYIMR